MSKTIFTMEKPKRNERCPCNSGRKYKDCHFPRKFDPDEYFEVKVTEMPIDVHGESIDGGRTIVFSPGLTHDNLRMRLHVRGVDSHIEDIEQVLAPLVKSIRDDQNILAARLGKLRHKLHAVRYHLENFTKNEDDEIAKLNAELHTASGGDLVIEDPKILYELEGFLFQIKSCLDVLVQLISVVCKLGELHSFGESGENVIKTLQQNTAKAIKPVVPELVGIIRKYQKWVSDIVDIRDEITHYSDLEGFSCFIRHAYEGGGKMKISYPAMPDGIRARKYVDKACKTLFDLVSKIVEVLARGNTLVYKQSTAKIQ